MIYRKVLVRGVLASMVLACVACGDDGLPAADAALADGQLTGGSVSGAAGGGLVPGEGTGGDAGALSALDADVGAVAQDSGQGAGSESDSGSVDPDAAVADGSTDDTDSDDGEAFVGTPVAVAVGYGARRVRSLDGESWTDLQEINPNGGDDGDLFRGLGYGDGRFIAVGGSGSGLVMTSDDGGESWQNEDRSAPSWLGGVVYLGDTFIAAGGNGLRMRSKDRGVTWTDATPYYAGHFRGIAAGNGLAVAAGHTGSGGIASSTRDGITWTPIWQGGRQLWGIAYGNGVFVAMGNGGGARTTDGENWTEFELPGSSDKVAFANGEFLVAAGSRYWRSSDGENWTALDVGSAPNIAGYFNGAYYHFSWGSTSSIRRSTDLSSWQTVYEVAGSSFEQMRVGAVGTP